MNIRKAMFRDATAVFTLLKQLASSAAAESPMNTDQAIASFHEIIQDENQGTVIVAEIDAEIVGVITLSYPVAMRCGGKYACIEEFIVNEQMRGKGVGSRLLKASLETARQRGCYELQVNNPSEIGYPLYINNDIKDTGRHLKIVFGKN